MNEDAEMLGAAPPEAADDEVPALELELELEFVELELDDELPQPAMSAAATRLGTIARFQAVIKDSPLRREGAFAPPDCCLSSRAPGGAR